jgi:hypothetical protein
MAMLHAGGVNTAAGGAAIGSCLSAMPAGSTKGHLGAKFPPPPRLQSTMNSLAPVAVRDRCASAPSATW